MIGRRASMLALIVVGAAASACSSSTGGSSPSASSTPTATPTATPAGPPVLVWAVKHGASIDVRVLSPSGGSPHTVASVPSDAQFVGFSTGVISAHKIAALYSDKTFHTWDISTSATTSFPSGSAPADSVFGGAFSPDGARFAYATVTTSSGALHIATLATGTSTVIHTYSTNTVDAPIGWTASRITAVTVVGFSDAGPQANVALDPATGTETSSTSIAGSAGSAFSADGVHVADSTHSMLGDEGDSPGGPGPQQPFNTLRTFSVGATPTNAYPPVAHHSIGVFAVSPSGSSVVYYNDSSAGGFAGISLSPDFGLFFLNSGSTLQLTHYGEVGRWDSGAFTDASTAVMAVHTGSGEQLVLVGPAHSPPTMIDSVAGGDAPVSVAYSPTS
jgi:hypothetical protein